MQGARVGALAAAKNSASISASGMAPQLTAMNGKRARGPCAWMARATSSLPLPDSPRMATGAPQQAMRLTCARSTCMAAELPISCGAGGMPQAAVSPVAAAVRELLGLCMRLAFLRWRPGPLTADATPGGQGGDVRYG